MVADVVSNEVVETVFDIGFPNPGKQNLVEIEHAGLPGELVLSVAGVEGDLVILVPPG